MAVNQVAGYGYVAPVACDLPASLGGVRTIEYPFYERVPHGSPLERWRGHLASAHRRRALIDRALERQALARMGHRLAEGTTSYGGYQAVARDPATGVLAGATESRKDGCAMGY